MRCKVELSMEYHKPSGRWLIKTAGPKTRFPAEEEMVRLWEAHFPNGRLFLGNVLVGKVFAFYVEVNAGSTKAQRSAFLNDLAAECH